MRLNFVNIKKFLGYYKSCRKAGIQRHKALFYLIYKSLNYLFKIEMMDSNIKNTQGSCNFIQNNEIPITKYLRTVFSRNNIILDKVNLKGSHPKKKTFIWFVPNCSNVWGGGHYTIFRFANFFANQHDVKNIIYLYDYNKDYHAPIDKLCNDLQQALPNCLLEVSTEFDSLPRCDAAIATTWQSAYFVDQFQLSLKKFYFMQDYESLFYAAGSNALQANYTYSFGFIGITGGHWLRERFESYGGQAQEYIFSADQSIFYPMNYKTREVKRLFFYGRPSTERRAFELGMAALELIAFKYPKLEIVIAGLDGLDAPSFPCTLKGNLSLKETGDLYRTCDIGIALSATNISYIPVELMASGCPVVTNGGPQVEWYCEDQINSIIVAPTPVDILNGVSSLIRDPSLRERLIKNGLEKTRKTTWEKEMEKIYHYIEDNLKKIGTLDKSTTNEKQMPVKETW